MSIAQRAGSSPHTEGQAPTTRAYRLAAVNDKHPIIPLVLEHRELSKLLGACVDALRLPTLATTLFDSPLDETPRYAWADEPCRI